MDGSSLKVLAFGLGSPTMTTSTKVIQMLSDKVIQMLCAVCRKGEPNAASPAPLLVVWIEATLKTHTEKVSTNEP